LRFGAIFYSRRHNFNSALAHAGVAEKIRHEANGHSSKMMNKNYTRWQAATFKNAATTFQ
jgi:hypothetical protein